MAMEMDSNSKSRAVFTETEGRKRQLVRRRRQILPKVPKGGDNYG
ncbi:hypothetical protein [Mesorhizobium kowhaii]|nr:hypothetical protein [Mesorhizobium kowhaii]